MTQATGSSASAKDIPDVIAPPPLIFLAAVILGGLLSATALNMVVLPALYWLMGGCPPRSREML